MVLLSFAMPQLKHLSNSVFTHQIRILHPAFESEGGRTYDLFEIKNETGQPVEFYMDVISVYCEAGVCQVDTVRLFWSPIGTFLRYELPANVELEKVEGKPFTNEDYELLSAILKDENSRFKNLNLSDIVKKNEVEHGVELDGYSGATLVNFKADASVDGAALTCFALWHYANGNVRDHIKRITSQSLSSEKVEEYLESDDISFKVFAINWFNDKKVDSGRIVETVVSNIHEFPQLLKVAQPYFEGLPTQVYFDVMYSLSQASNNQLRLKTLQSLKSYIAEPSSRDYFDEILKHYSQVKDYQELNVLLELMEERNSASQDVICFCFSLLKEDVVLSRRAYYYLNSAELTKKEHKRLERYKKKHIEYL